MPQLRRMRPLLGTFVEACAHGIHAGAGLDAAFASLELAQAWWSFQDPGSELSRLNRRPRQRVDLNRHTLRLLRAARAAMRASDGAFDCTVGGALVQAGALPDHGGAPALARGGAEDIDIGAHWARLRRPLRLTLDGIAKGYAVDLALQAMRRSGVDAGWINAGGDLRVFGELSLPVRRRELDGSFTDLGALRNAALASSRALGPDALAGADERFPAHIVAPAGAAPATGVWSVLARSAWRADALTKVAATVPAAQRARRVRQLGGCLVGPAGVLE